MPRVAEGRVKLGHDVGVELVFRLNSSCGLIPRRTICYKRIYRLLIWRRYDMIADMRISSHISLGPVPVEAPLRQNSGKQRYNSGHFAVLSLAAVSKAEDFCGELVNGR